MFGCVLCCVVGGGCIAATSVNASSSANTSCTGGGAGGSSSSSSELGSICWSNKSALSFGVRLYPPYTSSAGWRQSGQIAIASRLIASLCSLSKHV